MFTISTMLSHYCLDILDRFFSCISLYPLYCSMYSSIYMLDTCIYIYLYMYISHYSLSTIRYIHIYIIYRILFRYCSDILSTLPTICPSFQIYWIFQDMYILGLSTISTISSIYSIVHIYIYIYISLDIYVYVYHCIYLYPLYPLHPLYQISTKSTIIAWDIVQISCPLYPLYILFFRYPLVV